jgi:hypothetical protein
MGKECDKKLVLYGCLGPNMLREIRGSILTEFRVHRIGGEIE